ncbi:MAG: hypothetical protein ACHP7I_04730 [Terriglobales bacterium]
MTDETAVEISKKLNVLIAIALREILGDKGISEKGKRKRGVGEASRFLADLGLDAKDIAVILGAPLPSVRTLLTPKRRK